MRVVSTGMRDTLLLVLVVKRPHETRVTIQNLWPPTEKYAYASTVSCKRQSNSKTFLCHRNLYLARSADRSLPVTFDLVAAILFDFSRCCGSCIMSHDGHHGNTDPICTYTFKRWNCFTLCQSCGQCKWWQPGIQRFSGMCCKSQVSL